MKKQIFATVCSIAFSTIAFSQSEFLERQAEKVKNKAANRVENKIDEGIDKSMDKTEQGIEESVKGNKKKDKKNTKTESHNSDSTNSSTTNQSSEQPSGNGNSSSSSNSKSSSTNAPLKAYSKFDFVSGEKVLGIEQFEQASIGDFPIGWNTNGSAEIVTLGDAEGKWLRILQDGYYLIEMVTDLPENFTLEFDVFTRYRSSNILTYGFDICAMNNQRKDINTEIYSAKAGFEFNWSSCIGNAQYNVYENGEVTSNNDKLSIEDLACQGQEYSEYSNVHFSIWRQKNRLKIYVNEDKILDIPYALLIENKYNSFRFKTKYMDVSTSDNKDEIMVSDIRYAVGAPDTRSKLITEGKLVSRGILFNVNSDVIKPESYGTLKEISKVLIENPDVKIKIIGHTDSDGDDTANLSLSKKRAESVKDALNKEFGIAVSRIETDGKGESEPSEPNTSALGKANNRRVEFIKL